MAHDNLVINRFGRKIAAWSILRQSIAFTTLWIFLWGTAVLILRAATAIASPVLLWGAVGIPVGIALAARIALRRIPSAAARRAYIDRHLGCGGLLMAGENHDLGAWAYQLPEIKVPRLRWNARVPLILLMLSVGYVVLVFLIPFKHGAFAPASTLDVSRQVERLDVQVSVLKQEKVLEPDRAKSLQDKLAQVKNSSAAKEPAKTLEALDYLNEMVGNYSKKAAEKMAREANQLTKVEKAAAGLEGLPNDKGLTQKMKDLADLVQKAADESQSLQGKIDEKLAEALSKGKLSSEQLEKLMEAAKQCKEELQKHAKAMHDARLIDSEQLQRCAGKDAAGQKNLKDFLDKNSEARKKAKGEKKSADGNGGIGEDDPGDTDIEFGDPATRDGTAFKETALPQADLQALKDSITLGRSSTAPKRDAKAEPAMSGALRNAAEGGGSANTTPILPEHRGAVRRYFDRPDKE